MNPRQILSVLLFSTSLALAETPTNYATSPVPREGGWMQFLNIVHAQRDTLFKASHEERAAVVKKALDAAQGR